MLVSPTALRPWLRRCPRAVSLSHAGRSSDSSLQLWGQVTGLAVVFTLPQTPFSFFPRSQGGWSRLCSEKGGSSCALSTHTLVEDCGYCEAVGDKWVGPLCFVALTASWDQLTSQGNDGTLSTTNWFFDWTHLDQHWPREQTWVQLAYPSQGVGGWAWYGAHLGSRKGKKSLWREVTFQLSLPIQKPLNTLLLLFFSMIPVAG